MKRQAIVASIVLALVLPVTAQAQSINGQGARAFGSVLSSRGISVRSVAPRAPSTGQVGGAVASASKKAVQRGMKRSGASFLRRSIVGGVAKAVVGRAIGAAGALKPERAYSD